MEVTNMNPFNDCEIKTNNRNNSSLPLSVFPPGTVEKTAGKTSENDKIIFEELKALIFQDDWEELSIKLKDEYSNFPIDTQNTTDQSFTLVHYAASHKSVQCLNHLVTACSARTDIKAENGWVPIHLVVMSGTNYT